MSATGQHPYVAGPETAVIPAARRVNPDAAGQERLGPYRLVQLLGEGGMGVVYLGLDERGRGVAIKVLRDHIAHDPIARERLAREVSTLRRVRHPRVAPVVDADVEGARPYVVTRYVPGEPLDAWVAANGPLTGAALARLGRGLAEALGAIHDAGVVHRDLKPGNVLFSRGDPVVIDFGIAHVADEARLTHTGLVMGTPGYLSPELLDGDPVDESTDWWAWAATLAFAATGRPPFGSGPVDAVLHRVYRGEADLRGVDPRLQAVLRAALLPRAVERPRQDEILAALDVYAHGGDTAGVVGTVGGAPPNSAVTRAVEPPDRLDDTQVQPVIRSLWSAGNGSARSASPAVAPATTAQPVAGTRILPVTTSPADPGGRAHVGAAPGAYVAFSGARPPPGPQSGQAPAPQPPSVPPGTPVAAPAGVSAGPRRHVVQPALVALLVTLAALAMSWPLVAVLVAAGWAVLARTVEASAFAVYSSASERGRRRMDAPLAVLAAPVRAIPALLTTLLVLVPSSIVAAGAAVGSAAALTSWSGMRVTPGSETALAIGFVAGVLLGWWGIAGTSLRRGSRRTMRALTGNSSGVLVVTTVLLLGAVYLAIRSQASGVSPDWYPLTSSLLESLVPVLPG
ncbi:MAG: protein kinase [Micrococcales bacterium]|nr:protein kinase [Micrococcales bacterium]